MDSAPSRAFCHTLKLLKSFIVKYLASGASLSAENWKLNAYELELQTLENDLKDFRELYAELGNKITSIDERIAHLRKMKPE